MKTAHTPDDLICGIFVELSTMGLPGHDQFEVDGENRTCPAYLSRAQRDYTLRAVNSHEQLVEALEYIENNIMPDDEGNREITPRHMKRIRAALAKAKGEQQ